MKNVNEKMLKMTLENVEEDIKTSPLLSDEYEKIKEELLGAENDEQFVSVFNKYNDLILKEFKQIQEWMARLEKLEGKV